MSGPEQDDDGKTFLARWSQRKLEAKQPEAKPDPPAAASDDPKEKDQSGDPAKEFDPSTLPKLEDITGSTDVSAFLRKGVPEHLRNAALRKSWALDPAVRNYVSPALDYAYDWSTPGGVPGTSELGAGVDVAKLVAQIMGDESPSAGETPTKGGDPPGNRPEPAPRLAAVQKEEAELPIQPLRRSG